MTQTRVNFVRLWYYNNNNNNPPEGSPCRGGGAYGYRYLILIITSDA